MPKQQVVKRATDERLRELQNELGEMWQAGEAIHLDLEFDGRRRTRWAAHNLFGAMTLIEAAHKEIEALLNDSHVQSGHGGDGMKRQEEKYRKALEDIVDLTYGLPCDGAPDLLRDRIRSLADSILDATGHTTEMEQLVDWLETKTTVAGRMDTYDTGFTDAMKHVVWHIREEYDYGKEESE